MEDVGQRDLIDYGVQNDESDYRIHVGFRGEAVYLFETEKAREALQGNDHPFRRGRVPGARQDTYEGYLVPWQDIEGCLEIDIPSDILKRYICDYEDSTYKKGKMATLVVAEMLWRGLIPIGLASHEVEGRNLQMKGHDMLVSANFSVQVKCDWKAGRGYEGNIFLQTAERHLRPRNSVAVFTETS